MCSMAGSRRPRRTAGAGEAPTRTILLRANPYVIAMLLGSGILCIFPEIATWLPDILMGPVAGRS
jgi:TRAP-type C4-dicarboxylate transport system permease large subunit